MKIKILFSGIVLLVLFGCSGSDSSDGGGSFFYKVTMDGSTKTYSAAAGNQGLAYNGSDGVIIMAITSNGGGALDITNYDNNWEAGNYVSGTDDIVISLSSNAGGFVAMEDLTYTITSNNGSVIQGTF